MMPLRVVWFEIEDQKFLKRAQRGLVTNQSSLIRQAQGFYGAASPEVARYFSDKPVYAQGVRRYIRNIKPR
jgi:hypothetical protein